MSPIGRVFIVLNLILAGCFVGFAGTYLDRAANYKKMFEDEQKAHKQDNTNYEGLLAAEKTEVNTHKRNLASATQNLANTQNELASEKTTNQTLRSQLTKFQADHSTLAQSIGAIATEIKVANANAKQAMADKIAAVKEKDAAVSAKLAADRTINDLNFQIRNKEADIAKKVGEIAALDQTRREQKVLLDLVRVKVPAIFATLQPSINGKVEHVGTTGKLLTIAVDSGAEFLKAGHRFAIYNRTDGYLGEAVVTEWDKSKYAFATLNAPAEGARKVQAGDMASTNLTSRGAGKGN